MVRLAMLGMSLVVCLTSIVATAADATPPSSNGRRIAFSTDQSARPQIFSVRVDGSGLQQLTHVTAGHSASSPDWSPDGSRILFNSDVSGEQELWMMRADGSDKRRLTNDPNFADQQARWSPDGTSIVFQRCAQPFGFPDYCDIDLMDANGYMTKIVGGRWVNSHPQFSPDGQKIVFDSTRGGYLTAIWRASIDGSTFVRLTPPLMEAFYPDWSPNGRHILFDDNTERPHSNVWEMRPDGTHLTQITHVINPHNDAFARYSPNGRKIVFTTDQAYPNQCCSDVYVMKRDGSQQAPVATTEPGALIADWAPRQT